MPKPYYEENQHAWKLAEILCANPNTNITVDADGAKKIIEFVNTITKGFENQ